MNPQEGSSEVNSRPPRRLLIKTEEQKQAMEKFYISTRGEWSKKALKSLSQKIKLSQNQTYKYLWNKKKKDSQSVKKKFVYESKVSDEHMSLS